MSEGDNVLQQCLNINNAYKIKHEELKEVFNAYKELKINKNLSCSEIEIILQELAISMEKKIISKEKFNVMLDEQKQIMDEFNDINNEINKLYPDF
tara:strand:+ start:204 stop:491 length:288 start_codon:yes stop_codon:yes gene_type:complete